MNLKPAFAIVTALIITGILLGDRPTTPAPAADPTTTPSTPPHTNSPRPTIPSQQDVAVEGDGFHVPDESAVATPSYDGGEDPTWTLPVADQRRAVSAGAQFIDGWLQPDPTLRAQMLRPVAVEALVADLAGEGLRIWTTTATSGPQIVELASTTALLCQPFIDGRSVDLLLTAEPGSLHGWMVTDIAPTAGR